MEDSQVNAGGLLAAALVPLTHAAGSSSAAPVRPDIKPAPFHPGPAFSTSAPRTKTCIVEAGAAGTDDAPAILKAFTDCNHGGTVVLDSTYKSARPWT
ncbi:hypothetical protein CGRA01v4_09222 [Colletotrichum graminicola]|nr:hypothetical protein CGRA01v4_09222 [Colletotrichum graminicola]